MLVDFIFIASVFINLECYAHGVPEPRTLATSSKPAVVAESLVIPSKPIVKTKELSEGRGFVNVVKYVPKKGKVVKNEEQLREAVIEQIAKTVAKIEAHPEKEQKTAVVGVLNFKTKKGEAKPVVLLTNVQKNSEKNTSTVQLLVVKKSKKEKEEKVHLIGELEGKGKGQDAVMQLLTNKASDAATKNEDDKLGLKNNLLNVISGKASEADKNTIQKFQLDKSEIKTDVQRLLGGHGRHIAVKGVNITAILPKRKTKKRRSKDISKDKKKNKEEQDSKKRPVTLATSVPKATGNA